MVGLIWFVQIVHYPLFARVGGDVFAVYEWHHTRQTTWVVAPLMLTELVSAVAIVLWPPRAVAPSLAWSGLVLLAVIWLSTALLQVPCHRKLERGFDPRVARRLVSSNWVRTVAWSLRGLVALGMLYARA
ncbi:MAG: hypothetical protein GC164_16035 [Phycisphaera sp.]|nr:hypothetical protein [Phycisphaera sp.]